MKPKLQNIKLWIQELERNHFQQTTGALFHLNNAGTAMCFCAIGLGAAVAKFKIDGMDMNPHSFDAFGFEDFYGLPSLATCSIDDIWNDLIRWNDDDRLSFPEIGKRLRRHFELEG